MEGEQVKRAAADHPEPARGPTAAAETETVRSSGLLSRQSTDFGVAEPREDASRPDPLLGRDLGDVVIESVLGSGGMGRVYQAQQRSPSRKVAVKVMRAGHRPAAAVRRFRREAELLGRLRHPGIAQIFTAGCLDRDGEETPYFVMELIPGAESLIRAAEQRQLSTRERLTLFAEICRAVGHGHAAGVVHRDLKPGNILVDGEGRPKVIDFGIARLDEPDPAGATETGAFLGTRQYSSPEQCEGTAVTARSDVYSLGVILHELLSGRLPYEVGNRSLVESARIIQQATPAPLQIADHTLASGAKAIATCCLAKRPAHRYADATAVAADIDALLAGAPLQARQSPVWERAVGWLAGRPLLAAGGVAAALAVTVVAAIVTPDRSGRATGVTAGARSGRPGPVARFPNISSQRTTPLRWLSLTFDRPVQTLSRGDFRLTRDGQPLSLAGVTVAGERKRWELQGLETVTAREGRYVLELSGTGNSPVDLNGNLLATPARATWRMPPYAEIAFGLLDDDWQQYVVSMHGVECYTEQSAGPTTFFRPTVLGEEGVVVLRFPAPFPLRAATLTAPIAVWTTGDPFPYDPGAKAALDVSADGSTWTTLDIRQADHGGFGDETFDIRDVVAGSGEVWVRARLTATREWPEDGPIFAQFLRTVPNRPVAPFRLTLTGGAEGAAPPRSVVLPANN